MQQFKLSKTAHAVSALLLTLASSHTALAAPTGGNVVQGSATISQTSPSRTDINQNTDKAIINWQQFNINSGEQVNFNQPSQSSVTLNRVTGGSASDIQGALTANGNVFLINPNGIVFGKGAIIDVAGLVASTADIDDDNFMAGKFEFTGSGTGSIINEGNISVQQGGLVALVAPTVRNSGVIQAQLGRVALVSGNTFTVDLYGDGLINLAVDGKVAKGLVENSGTVNADGGKVLISAQAAKNIVDNVINMNGVVQARSIAGNNGNIVLSGGVVNVAGTLDASGGASHSGGDIDVLGQSINVAGTVNASGDTGGGEIHIGGDFQGKGDRQRASDTVIAQGAVIQADANTVGDGGRVIVWSDNKTLINGQISATGGSESGDGGFVETSSAGELDFTTSVDVKANNGKAGTWLIDPENITIDRDYADLIEESLNDGSSVIVQTSDVGNEEGNLNVNASITKDEGGDASLSLLAHNDLSVNAPITSTSGELDVNLKAGNSVTVNTSITTNGGGVFISKWDVPVKQTPSPPATSTESEPKPTTQAIPSGSSDAPIETSVASIEPTVIATTRQPIPEQSSIAATESSLTKPTTIAPQKPSAIVSVKTPIAAIAAQEPAPAPNIAAAGAVTDSISITIADNAALDTDGGDIVLASGDQGNVQVDGKLDSSSTDSKGGDIVVSGNTITLSSSSVLDASGTGASVNDSGGGNIALGDATGGSSDPADSITIEQGAQINANANTQGSGGDIYISSQTNTDFHGDINAQGAGDSNAGNVTIATRGSLSYSGNINVQANSVNRHNSGVVYIAADNLNIKDRQDSAGANNQLGMDQLQQLGDIGLQIRTENDLSFDVVNSSISFAQQSRAIELISNNGDIIVNPSSTNAANSTLQTNGGFLSLSASNGAVTTQDIITNGGSIRLTAQGNISVGNITTLGGSLSALSTQGNFISNGDINLVKTAESVVIQRDNNGEPLRDSFGNLITESFSTHRSGQFNVLANSIYVNSVTSSRIKVGVNYDGVIVGDFKFPPITLVPESGFNGSMPEFEFNIYSDQMTFDSGYFDLRGYGLAYYGDTSARHIDYHLPDPNFEPGSALLSDPDFDYTAWLRATEERYDIITQDLTLNLNYVGNPAQYTNGDSMTVAPPLDHQTDLIFNAPPPSAPTTPLIEGERITAPVTAPRPPVVVQPPVTVPPTTAPPVNTQPAAVQGPQIATNMPSDSPVLPQNSPKQDIIDSSEQTQTLENEPTKDLVVSTTEEKSGHCSDGHLAWLQSGIRSAAEIADMGRGDGTSGEDVFKNCF